MGGSETREQILDAAEAIVREGGWKALSLRAIAKRTGLSAPAAYRHFTDKEALLEALILRSYQGFAAGLGALCHGVSAPEERLRRSFRYYLTFWVRDRRGFELMADRGSDKTGLSSEAIAGGSFGEVPKDTALLLDDLPPEERARVGRWTAAALYGIALAFLADPPSTPEDSRAAIDSAAEYLVRAILARSPDAGARG